MLKLNTIYGKIKALLITVGVIFLILFLTLVFYKSKLEKQIVDSGQEQFSHEMKSLLALTSIQITQTVYDYAYWDDFVKALKNIDTNWYKKNVTFFSYKYDYVYIYNTKFDLVHAALYNGLTQKVIIPKEAVIRLKQTRFSHFFLDTPNGLMEVSAASVHPTRDPGHCITEPSGYLFVLRKWDQKFLSKMAIISGSNVRLHLMSDSAEDKVRNKIIARANLAGYDGKPVSVIVFSRILILDFYVTRNIMIILLLFILTVLLVSNFFAQKYINKPLKLVTDILKTENRQSMKSLREEPTEYGRIGTLFEKYILQKEEKEKRAAELISISGNGRKSLAFRRSL